MNYLWNHSFFDQDRNQELLKVDIYQRDNHNYIDMDLPGFSKENINIDYQNGYLTVRASKEENFDESTNYIRKERYYGEYSRSFYVGDVKEEKIEASFHDGILQVTYPTIEENETQKKIQIN